MIPQIAVKEYLSRPLDNHQWIKQLSKAELWEAVEQLKPRPNLYEGLRKHQLECFLLGVSHPQFAFWVDLGGGKSLITLELFNYWMECGHIRRAMVALKSDKAFTTWEKQVKRWGFTFPVVTLEGSSEDKWRALQETDTGLVLVARPGLRAMISYSAETRSGKTKWKVDKDLVAKFARGIGAMALDESTEDANHGSLNHAVALQLRKHIPICYILAGRPMGRDPTMMWSQFFIVDGGETLGPTLGLFREAFFTASSTAERLGNRIRRPPPRLKYAKDYEFKKRMMPALNRMIQHRSISYSSTECGGLPKVVPVVERVRFPLEAGEYYKRAVQAVIAARGNLSEVKNVFIRMRQLSSGFMGFKHDETSERAQIEFKDNPKFDRLMELLDEMPYDRKAVVFYEFTHSGRKITEALTGAGAEPIWLWSGTRDSKKELRRFEEDDRCRVAVINHRVGAYSLDGLQNVANYLFFYESPVSSIDREQAERRVVRQGQQHTVFQYDLIVEGSADEKILAYHREGADLVAALLKDPESTLR